MNRKSIFFLVLENSYIIESSQQFTQGFKRTVSSLSGLKVSKTVSVNQIQSQSGSQFVQNIDVNNKIQSICYSIQTTNN